MNAKTTLTWVLGGTLLLTLGASMGRVATTPGDREVHHLTAHSPSSSAPNWPVPRSAAMPAGETSFVRAAEASVDAVVHVQTASIVPEPSNPWLSMLGMATGRVAQGSGSGVVVDDKGLIVTNHHVIQGARDIRVSTSNGQSYPAEVVGSDPSTDLAVLKIEPSAPLAAMAFGNSDDVRVGEWVLAVGNPLNLTSTVTAGIVSAKGRNIRLLESNASHDIHPVESFLQTDAAVNPGNSGGALVDLDGNLIGINTAIASQTGSYAGYSFAIPSSIVAKVTHDLVEFGRVQRAYLGIQVDARATGVRIGSIQTGGGAEAAGLQRGDLILAVNGIDVSSFPSLQEQLSKHRPGDKVRLDVRRQGTQRQMEVTLTDRRGTTELDESHLQPLAVPQATASAASPAPAHDVLEHWGVQLEETPPSMKQQLKLRGGLIVQNMRDGAWKRQGLRRGFILLRIDGRPVLTSKDVELAVRQAQRDGQDGVLLEGMYSNGERAYAGVAVPDAHP